MIVYLIPVFVLGGLVVLFGTLALLGRFRGGRYLRPIIAFLSKVPLRFVIQDAAQRVHLAALFSPWGYSYYRGS